MSCDQYAPWASGCQALSRTCDARHTWSHRAGPVTSRVPAAGSGVRVSRFGTITMRLSSRDVKGNIVNRSGSCCGCCGCGLPEKLCESELATGTEPVRLVAQALAERHQGVVDERCVLSSRVVAAGAGARSWLGSASAVVRHIVHQTTWPSRMTHQFVPVTAWRALAATLAGPTNRWVVSTPAFSRACPV